MTQRNPDGTFAKGHTKTGGRSKRAREERYYEITINTVSFADWQAIVAKARDQAKKGDSVARKWLSDYLVGPPVQKNETNLTGEIAFVDETTDGNPPPSPSPGSTED